MRKCILLLSLLAPSLLYGQYARYDNIVLGSTGVAVGSQSIAVCTQPASVSTQPCSPLATIYSSSSGAAQANPLTADAYGNYHFYALPGVYTIQIYGPQIATAFVMTDVQVPIGSGANNTFTGNNTHSGTETFANINSIIFVDGTTHTTLASALAACPTTGCWVIDTIPETFTSNPFAAFTGNALVDFGAGTWTSNVQVVVPTKTVLRGIGRGDAGASNTTIKASGTFPTSTALIKLSNGGTANHGSRVEAMTLDCNGIAGSIGLYSTDINERSGAIDITVANFVAAGIKVDASANVGTGPAQHYILRDIELYPQTAGVAGTVGIVINANGGEGPDEVSNVTYVGNSGAASTNAFTVDNMTAGRFSYLHGEQATNVLNIGAVSGISGGTFSTVTAGPGTTTAVRVAGSSQGYNLFNVLKQSATNAIVDVDHSRTITSAQVGIYSVGNGATQPIFTTDASTNLVLPALAVLGTLNLNGNNLLFGPGSLMQNVAGTATAGLMLKKGSGVGNYTSASTTYVVVDATNLCNTVTIPVGWKLAITSDGNLGTATAATQASAALTDNASCSTANAGILTESLDTGTGAGVLAPFALNWVITGDGNVHNIALQFKTSNAADSATMLNATASQIPTMVFTLMPSN